jgi:MSHA pilin protein MshD
MARFVLKKKQLGFTLIELVIGIIAFAIVITLVTGLIVPQATRSIDPIFQVRATELAQSLMNEINAKAFDEQSDNSNGGLVRCGESMESIVQNVFGVPVSQLPASINLDDITPNNNNCTAPEALGPDNEVSRADYDDVDDFNGLDDGVNNRIVNSLGEEILLGGNIDLYEGFQLQVSVFYDADFDGVRDPVAGDAKLIIVTVTTPSNETLQFSNYRTNF